MHKATWKGKVIAESDKTIVIEGNVYFPPNSIKREYFASSETHTTCPWKGFCSYYNVTVDGETNQDAAWYYHEPKEGSNEIVAEQNDLTDKNFSFADYVAFWKGVQVEEVK